MRMYDIIQKKKDALPLTEEEIRFFIKGYTDGSIPDYQASALAMAIYFNGMTDEETAWLTDAMMHSGSTIDLSAFGDKTVDKHSTGGVGDKTTLIVAPIVASIGAKVAKMSGRGLGHTGGTVDKLESLTGYRTEMSPDEFMRQVADIGICVIGQSGELAPADKKLYALRDVTATVDSIPLIASSIMSKKLAAGTKSIVLDVKAGSGAFMKTVNDAKTLAEKMVKVGKLCGRNIRALITNMDMPLGSAVGNALEVIEAVGVLNGTVGGDLKDVCVALATNMVSLSLGYSNEESLRLVNDAIDSKKALAKMREWISVQGGDVSLIDDASKFPGAAVVYDLRAECDGYIAHMDTEKIGLSASLLGAGRKNKEDVIDFAAGITILAKTGDFVKSGDVIALLHTSDTALVDGAAEEYMSALEFSDSPVEGETAIYAVVE